MSNIVEMPKLGLTMTEGKILSWLKQEGDPVKAGEGLVEIETDKINSEVESPVDGYILKILALEGQVIKIIEPLCVVGKKDEIVDTFINEKSNDISSKDTLRIIITPIARQIAKQNGIDLATLIGTGPGGRIVKEDVLAAIQKSAPKSEPVDMKSSVEPISAVDVQLHTVENKGKIAPLTATRKIIAQKLSQSKHDIPHAYFKTVVNAENIMELKTKISESIKTKTGVKLTLNDIIVKAVGVVLKQFPDINVSLSKDDVIYHKDINIGIAVDSEKGLIVPVIKNVDRKSLSEICIETVKLVERARSGKLGMNDITGGTFTISNLGAYYIDEFTAIINPPESAILAIGRASEKPCVVDGQIVARPLMNLTLSVDHRVIDGALAARFLKQLKDSLENPYLLLI